MIEGISEISSGSASTPSNINVENSSSGGGREKFLNVVLLIMVFVLLGLFAYLFFTDRLIIGVENPFSSGDTDNSQDIESEFCTYEGVNYTEGESFPSSDGCNSCSCTGGEVACTLMACGEEEDASLGCSFEGQNHQEGESFEAADGCNTCSCTSGEIVCTEIDCTNSN